MKKILTALCLSLAATTYAGSINGRWLDYYDEGDSIRVANGSSVTTRKAKERAGTYLKTGIWKWDIENKSVSFRVSVSDWNEVEVVSLILGNGIKLEKSATFDIENRFVNAPNNEWVDVVVPKSAWIIDGEVEWDKIDTILFVIADKGNKRVSAKITHIETDVIADNTVGQVSITFDDGYADTKVGADILAKFGYAGTAFIDTDKIGQPGYLTKSQLIEMQLMGWDFGGHNIGKLSNMDSTHLTTHLDQTKGYLDQFGGSKIYALPNGERNQHIIDKIQKDFPYVFNIDGMANYATHLHRVNINRFSVDNVTRVSLAKKWVDAAKNGREWVIINFHTLSDAMDKPEDWSAEDLTELLQYIKLQNIPVVPVSQVINSN